MNGLDFILVALFAAFALRGYLRGFIREGFGLLALAAGIVAALLLTGAGTAAIEHQVSLPPVLESAGVFVGIFVVVQSVLNATGALVDRLVGGTALRTLSRFAGGAFGIGKGAIVLGFVLLFLHLFPVVPTVDTQLLHSHIGRPLVAAASDAVRYHMQDAAPNWPSRT